MNYQFTQYEPCRRLLGYHACSDLVKCEADVQAGVKRCITDVDVEQGGEEIVELEN